MLSELLKKVPYLKEDSNNNNNNNNLFNKSLAIMKIYWLVGQIAEEVVPEYNRKKEITKTLKQAQIIIKTLLH